MQSPHRDPRRRHGRAPLLVTLLLGTGFNASAPSGSSAQPVSARPTPAKTTPGKTASDVKDERAAKASGALPSTGAWMGMAVEAHRGGLRITRVADRGPAARAGLKAGAVLRRFNGQGFSCPEAARRHVVGLSTGRSAAVEITHGKEHRTLAVRPESQPKPPGYVRLFLSHAPLPDFSLPNARNKSVFRLASQKGKVVVLFFFSSHCEACMLALPHLKRLHRRLGSRDLAIIGVGRDPQVKSLRDLVTRERIPFPVLHDGSNSVGSQNRLRVIPSLVVLDRQGVVRSFVQGATYTTPQLERVVRRIQAHKGTLPSRVRSEVEVWI